MEMGRLKAGWRGFNRSFNVEAKAGSRSIVLHWLTWIFPLLLFTVISANFSAGTMLELPVAAVDNDHSTLSRRIIRDLDAGSHAQITQYNDLQQALVALRSAKIYALLYIPHNFEADVLAARQPTPALYYNGLYYGAGLYSTQDFPGLTAELNQTYSQIIAAGIGRPLPPLAQVSLSYESLFNASGNFIYYQLFAATIHILQLFVVTCTIYVLSRRKVLLNARPFSLALIGKLAPYTIIYTLLLMVELAALVTYSGARINGNPLFMLAIGFFYIMAAQSIGLLLFTFTKDIITAYTLIGLLVGIAMTYSGTAVPELSMPLIAQIIANIEPLTHALYALFDVFLRGVPASSLVYVCVLLLVYPLITAFLVRKRLPKRLQGGDIR
ncbi:ABC transporter permease [Budviciaceae bacterium CWB-B4]|uniref:ABC transporter permease n=1 Tax=Limnobaculum xujianqingii TaxID=2738837 RepID=A0A9D7FVL9_9GAMM|nr:ABC transporter permease [Limnobaculum xujianqingii]MBK5071567.1 ABC transporter permease [Limnobaculum xujianqingii]MBK5174876.1 ABC transporter permease [Limnobaculum xujianqingii]